MHEAQAVSITLAAKEVTRPAKKAPRHFCKAAFGSRANSILHREDKELIVQSVLNLCFPGVGVDIFIFRGNSKFSKDFSFTDKA